MIEKTSIKMKLFVFDQFFKDLVGHAYNYNRSLSEGFSKVGIPVLVYGNQSLNKNRLGKIHAIPFFEHGTAEKYFKGPAFIYYLPNLVVGNFLVWRRLKHLDSASLSENDILYFPMILQWHIIGILLWYAFRLKKPRPYLYLMLRLEISYSFSSKLLSNRFQPNIPIFWAAFRFLNICNLSKVFLLSDTPSLADKFSRLASRRVFTLPIPHTRTPKRDRGSEGMDEAVISFVGEDRFEKGFLLLPEAMRIVLESRNNVKFVIQANSPRADKDILKTRAAIQNIDPLRIIIIDTPLDTDSYFRLIATSDCVIAAYDPILYGGRSSGVLTEAISYGKAVITTKKTWMETLVNRFDCGVVMDEYNSKGLANAIVRYLDNRTYYDQNALAASHKIREEHNMSHFVQTFLAISTQQGMSR